MEQEKVIKISVRHLVEFLLRSGDIDNRHHGSPDTAMQEGSRIHREIQKSGGESYQAEVPLKYISMQEGYSILVEGRADGIIETADSILIDEIKGTYRDLFHIREPEAVHLAQARCYAYMYMQKGTWQEVTVRMTYCNLETEEKKYFENVYTREETEEWFLQLVAEYRKWADMEYQWGKDRDESIQKLEFPYPYREGQKDLITYVYRTIYHEKKLFIEAPTGVGKTISTIFPAVKAMERGMGDKIFYLTAKTITRTVADQTFQLLREAGLKAKSVVLTAKEKICFIEHPDCNPVACPYAKGHLDRINDALFDILTTCERYDRETIEMYAQKYQVCPFEFSLDISLFCDGIIGDYNYLFDPHVFLKRFFTEGVKGNYIFLIDEAHNLLERGREMYSAVLIKEDFLKLKKAIMSLEEEEEYKRSILYKDGYAFAMIKALDRVNKAMLALKKECEGFRKVQNPDQVIRHVESLKEKMEGYLEETEEVALPVRDEILDFYFIISHFMTICEIMDEKYVNYTEITEQGEFYLKLFCVDPSNNLRNCMKRGRSTMLFSATFLPIQYYKSLLGGEEEDYEVYANSIFDEEKRRILIGTDVTSKYTRRGESEYERICDYIYAIADRKKGNYMVFFPSYQFMESVHECFERKYGSDFECLQQGISMNEKEREEFLKRFEERAERDPEHSLVGFCILGGIFGEGIDLKSDSLIGAIIVGTGLPQVCNERELLKNYFDTEEQNGFDYAYRYPGMNKVLQAAGRVIRTEEDLGIIALLDERFQQASYRNTFPKEWEKLIKVNVTTVGDIVETFWDSYHRYS